MDLLDHWHEGRKIFTVLQAAQLLGTLEHAATVAPWLRYLFDSLRHSLLQALRKNTEVIYKNMKLKDFLNDMSYKGSSFDGILKKNFATSYISKKNWHSKRKYFITSTLSLELSHLRQIFSRQKDYRLFTPISFLVDRTPDFTAYSDACLEGAGGFSHNLKFWWHFHWPSSIQKQTLKKFSTSIRLDQTKFISINLLEYITIIITYAGAIHS